MQILQQILGIRRCDENRHPQEVRRKGKYAVPTNKIYGDTLFTEIATQFFSFINGIEESRSD